ncbi:hypothetical protein INT48_000269 [Thamnidium elegans]|uniref:BSD domain-containing protein n=1 Tax=Thamnidium elegans TaxID=101142 RepID=A0A8H7SRT5_9FUNG|nr:hypothetical protein INT48_000269 [Thamnidium elegans]
MTDESNSSTNKAGFFGSSFFSNVSSSVTALSQTIQTKGLPEMNKRLNELQQKAREIPGQIALLQGDLEHERTSFIQQNKNAEAGAHRPVAKEPVAPWVGYNGYEKEMKEAIINISKDERNFLISPPEDTSFQFDLNAYSQSAQAALKEDQVLSKMRFTLVPQQVQEPTFWRNYFYRVTIAKQNVLSHPPTEQEVKEDDTVLFNFQEEVDEGSDNDFEVKKNGQKDEMKVEQKDEKKVEQKDEKKVEQKDEKKVQQKDEDFEGMEDWEIELRKAAIL